MGQTILAEKIMPPVAVSISNLLMSGRDVGDGGDAGYFVVVRLASC